MIGRGFTTDGTGEKLTPFPIGGGGGGGTDTDDQLAAEVPYDNSGSGLPAGDVQAAIDALAAQVAAQFSEGDLLSTGEVGGGTGKQDQIYPDFVTPVDGDFAWINQGGALITVNGNGGLHLAVPANSGDSIRIRKKAIPGSTYTFTACFFINVFSVDSVHGGLVFRQSSDGKLVLFEIHQGNTLAEIVMRSSDWTSPTAFSATNSSLQFISPMPIWLRGQDNGSNRIMSWSLDGYNFETFFSEGRTTFLTADEIGFFGNTSQNVRPAGLTLLSWDD